MLLIVLGLKSMYLHHDVLFLVNLITCALISYICFFLPVSSFRHLDSSSYDITAFWGFSDVSLADCSTSYLCFPDFTVFNI